MGKRKYAQSIYGEFEESEILDLSNKDFDLNKEYKLILNLHYGVKELLRRKEKPSEYFMSRIKYLKDSVIIGDEIGSGVIPIDKFERLWRDETGKIYQFLANEADIVDRVFAGLAIRLKG